MAEDYNDRSLSTYQTVSGFKAEDIILLAKIGPFVEPYLPQMTDKFYARLLSDPTAAAMLEGRVEALKATHLVWLKELFSGQSEETIVRRQEIIGQVHVKARIPPLFLAASMSFLRGTFPELLALVLANKAETVAATAALMRTLDLCQYLIDRTYLQCLMDNLGIKPALLNRLMAT